MMMIPGITDDFGATQMNFAIFQGKMPFLWAQELQEGQFWNIFTQ